MKLEERIRQQLQRQKDQDAFRQLKLQTDLLDFCSNDYLGFARDTALKEIVAASYAKIKYAGSTGSRLLSGEHEAMQNLESLASEFHQAAAALLFNSGYDANLALLAALPRRGDVILYDELVHASMHDGMRLSKAAAHAFGHNHLGELEQLLSIYGETTGVVFVLVESIYSMDGDQAPLKEIAALCQRYGAYLMVDEAHATGVLGNRGEGLVQALGLAEHVWARLHTFGKALGGHGAVVLGSELLRDYLINYARPLIYTTALPLHSVIHATAAYQKLQTNGLELVNALNAKIAFFVKKTQSLENWHWLPSHSPIQGLILGSNQKAILAAQKIQEQGFDVRPIRSPTVPTGTERLRICLHLYNTEKEIEKLITALQSIN